MDHKMKVESEKYDMNCIPQETCIKNVKLAAAYVPFQKMCSILYPMEALRRGTIFPELYSPYQARKKSLEDYKKNKGGDYYYED